MESYDDPAKSLSRDKIYDFILNHLIRSTLIRPNQIKVVCLETPEALEIKKVYDPLGILRKNIIVIERDSKVAKQIEDQNLGIKVVNCWDYEYFESNEATADGPFHIISLDYKCKKNSNIIKSISLITDLQLLSPGNSILIINTYGTREYKEQELLIESAQFTEYFKNNKSDDITVTSNNLIQSANETLDNYHDIDLNISQARNLFTADIIGILGLGDDGKSFCGGVPLLFCYPNSSDHTELIKSLYEKEEGCNILEAKYIDILKAHHIDNFKNYLMREFKILHHKNPKAAIDLIDSIILLFIRSYYVRNLERYKYISINGAPMEIDFFHIINHEHIIKKVQKIFSIKKTSYGNIFKADKYKIKNYKKFHNLICAFFLKSRNNMTLHLNELPERVFLGSSIKMLKTENTEVMTPEKDNCKTQNNDVLTNNQVQKKKMGNKKKKVKDKIEKKRKSKIKTPEISKPDPTKGAITKEQAIELLKDGCTPKEIAECFSGFSARSLSAIKAHITMKHL